MDFTGYNPHSVAALLKSYFRELPEPVLTFGTYDKLSALSIDGILYRFHFLPFFRRRKRTSHSKIQGDHRRNSKREQSSSKVPLQFPSICLSKRRDQQDELL
jgi:hypothetical protein